MIAATIINSMRVKADASRIFAMEARLFKCNSRTMFVQYKNPPGG